MKAYQVVENGKPLEEKEMETPNPTGKEILLKDLNYWNVELQEAYFSPAEANYRFKNTQK